MLPMTYKQISMIIITFIQHQTLCFNNIKIKTCPSVNNYRIKNVSVQNLPGVHNNRSALPGDDPGSPLLRRDRDCCLRLRAPDPSHYPSTLAVYA